MMKSSRMEQGPAKAPSERSERERRLAAALRDNLRRRKQQGSERTLSDETSKAPPPAGDRRGNT